ncbi:hypothetical protein MLT67_12310 [Escherichia coli]|nr:hypothetical protein [Escherichia coli]MCN2350128.1 hypothetical protein [Escherichia coli]MCN2497814.1 hypothetical protein [Escherichia coli]
MLALVEALEALQHERDELQLGFIANQEEASEAIKYATELKEQLARACAGSEEAFREVDEMQKLLDHTHRRRAIWRGRAEATETEIATLRQRITVLEGMNAASVKYGMKVADSRDKLRNKVNELEARTVTIPDYQDDAYWVYEWSGLTFLPWTYQKDVIKAVRVAGVAVEGE